MTVQYPIAMILFGLVFLLFWIHRRGQGGQTTAFSLFFLLDAQDEKHTQRADRLHSIPLLILRLIGVVVFIFLIAGLDFDESGGTIVLLDGPAPEDSSWIEPVTYIRAGQTPTQVTSSQTLEPVLARPNWTAAAILGRQIDPKGTLVIGESQPRGQHSVGAELLGRDVVVQAHSTGQAPVVLHQDGISFPMKKNSETWRFQGQLSPGAARIDFGEGLEERWVCIPDARSLKVSRVGWPEDVDAVLKTMDTIEFVDPEDAQWVVGESAPAVSGWAFSAPRKTHFVFETRPTRSKAPLWFPRPLPNPGIVAHRWSPLTEATQPVLFAGSDVVADFFDAKSGRVRRFGFMPEDTELPDSAAWPVLFQDAVHQDRIDRTRCREVTAGQGMVLWSETPVEITEPNGQRTTYEPKDGLIVLGPLDMRGVYALKSLDGSAQIVVSPRSDSVEDDRAWAPPPPMKERVDRTLLFWLGIGVLSVLIVFSYRRPWILISAAGILTIGFYAPVPGGERGPIVVAVDVSGSMPLEETQALLDEVETFFGAAVTHRVEGAESVRRVVQPGEEIESMSGDTAYNPLLGVADELTGGDGVILLIGDGLTDEAPTYTRVPVFAVPLVSRQPDGFIVDGSAVALGGTVFASVRVGSDRPMNAQLEIGAWSQNIELDGRKNQEIRVAIVDSDTDLNVYLRVNEDRRPQNNRYVVPVDRPEQHRALFVSNGPDWFSQGGLNSQRLGVESFLENCSELNGVRAIALVDVSSGQLPEKCLNTLETWVRTGGLLLLAGRTQAFSAGEWEQSTLDALSPVSAKPGRGTGKQLGVVVLLDRSGSISEEAGGIGLEKMGRLAAAVAGALEPEDRLAVIAFGGSIDVLQPIVRVEDLNANLPVPTRAIGGTRLLPALRAARTHLEGQGIDERIIVIATDGDFADEDDWAGAVDELSTRPGERIVALMVGEDPTMELIKRVVGASVGSVTRVTDDLITIGLKKLREVESTGVFKSGGVVMSQGAWPSRVGGQAPPVGDMIRAGSKKGAHVLASLRGEPLLAEWLYGRGRVIALTTDEWSLLPAQWAALFSPATMPFNRKASVSVTGDSVELRMAADQVSPRGYLTVSSPSGDSHRIVFRPSGPGRSSAKIPRGPMGVASLLVESSVGDYALRAPMPQSSEWSKSGVGLNFLTLQAELMGGALLDQSKAFEQVLEARAYRRPDFLFALFGFLALAFLLLDAYLWSRRP